MALSYPLRLVCVLAISVGLLHLAFELFLAGAAPLLLRLLPSLSLRRRERLLYLAQLAPFVLALCFGAFFFANYVANETNFASEHVGWPSLVCAGVLLAWWARALFLGLHLAVRTMRFGRAYRMAGGFGTGSSDLPIVAATVLTPRIALVGLLRPFIYISKSLLDAGGLDPLALEVVLDHERSHAAQRDNWKLLSLWCLPRLNLTLMQGKSWMQLWQLAAECAADEDAVRGSSARAFVLAETLVALARANSAPAERLVCTHFGCDEADLAQRVEHLIERCPISAKAFPIKHRAALCLLALAAAAILVHCAAVLRDLPEQLLHLG
jgi:hypothetical protein